MYGALHFLPFLTLFAFLAYKFGLKRVMVGWAILGLALLALETFKTPNSVPNVVVRNGRAVLIR